VVVFIRLVGGASLHPTVLGLRSEGMLTRGLPSFLLGMYLFEITVEIQVGRITLSYVGTRRQTRAVDPRLKCAVR
jgi:hypothetical protein